MLRLNLLLFSALCRSALGCLGVAKQPCTPRVVFLTALTKITFSLSSTLQTPLTVYIETTCSKQTVRNIIPEIYCFCLSAYRNHSILQFGNFSLMSRVGPQQGDTLAGLLFCLAIQKLLRATGSTFISGYMDDIALGGNIRDVARDVDYIRTEGEAIGLFLNNEKCEIISRSDTSSLTQAGTFISSPF